MNTKRESYTTFEAALLCHVSHHSIKNWIRRGLIKAIRTPGGHYRIKKDELTDFMRKYNMLDEDSGQTAAKEAGNKILVVDDDKETLKLIRDILTSNKFKVIDVDNGFDAGMYAMQEKPDLIILDFLMPRVDGFDVCRSLRKNPKTKKIKILALTCLTAESQIERMYEYGIDDYLAKPFEINELLTRVNTLLNIKKV
jgi:excisionase family DNA binding protein